MIWKWTSTIWMFPYFYLQVHSMTEPSLICWYVITFLCKFPTGKKHGTWILYKLILSGSLVQWNAGLGCLLGTFSCFLGWIMREIGTDPRRWQLRGGCFLYYSKLQGCPKVSRIAQSLHNATCCYSVIEGTITFQYTVHPQPTGKKVTGITGHLAKQFSSP